MIISCTKCNKNFEINSDLIPNKGRLLECSYCHNQWFFKKLESLEESSIKKTTSTNQIKDSFEQTENEDKYIEKNTKKFDGSLFVDSNHNLNQKNKKKPYKKNKVSVLNLILILVITFVAIIIFLDTFKSLISVIIPNIEFILNNLYETIKDVTLFFKDLV